MFCRDIRMMGVMSKTLSRLHKTRQASEMAFMVSRGALTDTTTQSSLCTLTIHVELSPLLFG